MFLVSFVCLCLMLNIIVSRFSRTWNYQCTTYWCKSSRIQETIWVFGGVNSLSTKNKFSTTAVRSWTSCTKSMREKNVFSVERRHLHSTLLERQHQLLETIFKRRPCASSSPRPFITLFWRRWIQVDSFQSKKSSSRFFSSPWERVHEYGRASLLRIWQFVI